MAGENHPTLLQHLLLGMNAHINLDLGIAAAEVCREDEIAYLQKDFFEVNHVLAGLLDEIQAEVDKSSPLYGLLDRLGWQADEAICNFSIRKARSAAWSRSQQLHRLPGEQRPALVDEIDREVTELAKRICPQSGLANTLFQAISSTEILEPGQIIGGLL